MALSDMAVGAQGAVQQIMRQRMLEQQMAEQATKEAAAQAQQQFQNQQTLRSGDRADAQLEMMTQDRGDARTLQAVGVAGNLADQLPPETFIPEKDPAVGLLQQGGRGSLLTATPEFKAVGPDFAGPQQNGVTPEQAAVGRPGGFIKTASQKQLGDQATQENQRIDNERQAKTQDMTAAARQAMDERLATTAERQAAAQQTSSDRLAAGQTETARHNRAMEARPAGGAAPASADNSDAEAIADAIATGKQPPETTGLYRYGAPVRAALAKKGYDMSTAQTDWKATQRHFATLNNAQQTRLRQATDNAYHSLDVIEDLAGQWKGGKFPVLNRAQLAAAKGGALGPQAQQIATNLEAQISDVASELGNVYMGGNSPTDHALSMAAKNLSSDWTEAQLKSALNLARRNLQIRQNSISNTGVIGASADNPYDGRSTGGGVAAPAAGKSNDPMGLR